MKIKSITRHLLFSMAVLIIASSAYSKNLSSAIKEENVTYQADGVIFKGFIAYDESIKGKRPAVLVVHEWWGLNDYAKMRARKLAESGYVAMAVDMYGDGKIAVNPAEAQVFTTPFYGSTIYCSLYQFRNAAKIPVFS